MWHLRRVSAAVFRFCAPCAQGWRRAASLRFFETGDATRSLPMVIAIHGLGDRPQKFGQLFGAYPMRVRWIFPEAPIPSGRGFSWFKYSGQTDQQVATGIRHAAEQIVELAKALQRIRPTRGKPIVTGFSQGGMLSFAAAAIAPDVWHASLPISGWLPEALWPTPAQARKLPPLFAVHGENDTLVDFGRTQGFVRALKSRGAAIRFQSFPAVPHRVSNEMRNAVYQELSQQLQRLSTN